MSITPIIKQLFAAYPNTQATVATIAIYDRLLADIPPAELQTVVDQCIATCKFLPTVAELRDEWHKLTATIGQPSATEAWADVLGQIRAVGYIGLPEFANPITAQVVRSLGWRELCASENMVADRAHFLRMYDSLVERGQQVQKLLPQSVELADRMRAEGQRRAIGLQPISRFLPAITRTEDN